MQHSDLHIFTSRIFKCAYKQHRATLELRREAGLAYSTCRLGLVTHQRGGLGGDNGRVAQSVLSWQRCPLVHLRF